MKKYETRTQTSSHEELTGITCDLCGRAAKSADRWDGGAYVVNDTEVTVTVRQREGHEYPGSGSGTEYSIDLCPQCFKDRLVPWLREQGARIEPLEWDW